CFALAAAVAAVFAVALFRLVYNAAVSGSGRKVNSSLGSGAAFLFAAVSAPLSIAVVAFNDKLSLGHTVPLLWCLDILFLLYAGEPELRALYDAAFSLLGRFTGDTAER
nr:hypothetical protein [Clostridia bacterium]